MTLILIQIIVRSIGSTLQWLGFNAGIRALPGGQYRQTRWMVGSAIVFAAWLFAIVLLASQNVFRTEVGSLSVPIVAYWLYARKPWARRAAIAWNLFGMADLINAVMLGALTGGGGIAFPTVLIPVHDAPRSFLIHPYSLIGLFRRSSHPAKRAEPTRYRLNPNTLVRDIA